MNFRGFTFFVLLRLSYENLRKFKGGGALTFSFEGGGGIENIWTIIRGGAMKQLKCGVWATKKDWNPENSLTLFHIFCSGYPRIQFAAPYMANIG